MIAELGLTGTLALLAVVVIGLPHGAMDAAVALSLGYRGMVRLLTFLVVYTLTALAVVMFWLAFPSLSLALFLLISMVHFGLGDTEPSSPGSGSPGSGSPGSGSPGASHSLERWVQALAHGGLVVVAIPYFHQADVAAIFSILGAVPGMIWPMLDAMAYAWLAVGAAYALLAMRRRHLRFGLAEWVGLLVLMALMPPLAGFALYFCCVHTPRHVRRILRSLAASSPPLPVYKTTVGLTLATWLAGGVCLALLSGGASFSEASLPEASLQVVFIGLAALTVPHMILIDGIFRPAMEQPRP